MIPFSRALLATTAAAVASLVPLLGVSPAVAGTPAHLKMCANDYYKSICMTRQSYDSNFNNDKYCASKYAPYEFVFRSDCGWYQEHDFEDKVSSVDNNSPNWWKMFENRDYRGYTVCVRPWGYDSDLGNNTSFEDDASSARREGTSQPGGCDKVVG